MRADQYHGNGNTGFDGAIGNGTLTLTDDGTNISGTLTVGGSMNDVLVLYIQTGPGGFADTSGFDDQNDYCRQAISGVSASGRSLLTFASSFQPNYALALAPTAAGFGGLWQLANGGNNSLVYLAGVNLAPLNNSGPYTFSFPASLIGLVPGVRFTIQVFGTYVSNTGYRSTEAIAGNLTGSQGWNPFTQTAYANYTFDAGAVLVSIDWQTVAGGGGTSTSAVYSVSGTIGQPDAGHAASANYSVDSGFWSILAVVQTPGLPWLSIAGTTTNTVLVYWPAGGLSCVLLESPTMATNSWTHRRLPAGAGGNDDAGDRVPAGGEEVLPAKGPVMQPPKWGACCPTRLERGHRKEANHRVRLPRSCSRSGGGQRQGSHNMCISLGREQRNDLPPLPAIAAEIHVQCEHLAIGVQFGEPHQARVGQRHGGVLVAAHEEGGAVREAAFFQGPLGDPSETRLNGRAAYRIRRAGRSRTRRPCLRIRCPRLGSLR